MWRHKKYASTKLVPKFFLHNLKFCVKLAYYLCAELMQDASEILVGKQSILLLEL